MAGLADKTWDAVFLSLHGAMIGPDGPSADLDLLAAVRARIGSAPLTVSFDLHANLDPAAARYADITAAGGRACRPPACRRPVLEAAGRPVFDGSSEGGPYPSMCGRYSLTSPVEAVRRVFDFPERPNLAPRANIAPSQEVAAVRLGPGESGDDGREHGGRCFVWLRWGLIPAWAKDTAIGNRMINARAETLAEKPAFRSAFRRRRCLIPADGFYEWKSEHGRKQPYRITLAVGGPFALAGLWECWTDPQGAGTIESCTIITTEANDRLREIHHRMPAILAPESLDPWLDPKTPAAQAQALLRPYPAEALTHYRVSPRLNSPANDDPALIEPLDAPADPPAEPGGQTRLL